jgi:aryl-alcohol dehydrogenase-like predicted oxidoreductase
MQTRKLGGNGPTVSALGLGCMGMSEFYGAHSDAESLATIHRALALGVNFLDTADAYGPYTNEELVGRALQGRRADAFLATKFGFVRDAQNPTARAIDGRAARVREACEGSLRRLQVEHIDLYYLHRADPQVPIEETVGAMAELVRAGKVRFLGLSEAGSATLRRAVAVHPIAALQTEYSLWTRDVEDDILPTCRSLGIGLVAYSPLGRGFLSGRIETLDNLAPNDFRRNNPRFQGDNLAHNLVIVERLRALAAEKGATPAQLALAWLLAQGPDVIPIPGTRSRQRLEENAAASRVLLSAEDLARIDEALPPSLVAGERYPEASMALIQH